VPTSVIRLILCLTCVSVPDWLEPIIREAAERDGMGVSAFMVDAAKTVIATREATERRQHEAEHGIDREAQLARAEAALRKDRRQARGVKGAA
jgi:hypothetical protein